MLRPTRVSRLVCCLIAVAGCAPATASSVITQEPAATLAKVYYWRARAGKLEEYNRYVREVAEQIDHAAQRQGAFLTVTTFVARDTLSPWTHMRIFLLRDSTQLAGLSASLARAGEQLEPDSAKRRVRGEYSATLRDRVGDATLELLR